MEEISIQLTNLNKTYPLYKRPFDRLLDIFHVNVSGKRDYVALKDLTIGLPKGESIGVLGKNGAGKSTLLKIVTGVIKPTKGSCEVKGKIAAILELNAGFDNDLTGLENIYLKGTLSGYTEKDIDKQLDNIIDFADIGEHMHQPVRTYSSGMKARLGFAIAVHVNPDILIIDEALSVGDEMFKMKCLNKIKSFKEAGKTILFVSHSLGQVRSFCTKAVWLKDGNIEAYGDAQDICNQYELYLKEQKQKIKDEKNTQRIYKLETPDDYVERTDFYVTDETMKKRRHFKINETALFHVKFIVKKEIKGAHFWWSILDAEKRILYASDKINNQQPIRSELNVEQHIAIQLQRLPLMTGKYLIKCGISDETGILQIGLSWEQPLHINAGDKKGSGTVYLEHEFIQKQ